MTPPGGERFPGAGAVPQGAALFVSEEVTAYGNKSGIDRHHRGAGIFGGGAERAAARIRRLNEKEAEHLNQQVELPYRERGVNIISVVLDAPQDKIAALSGKIGRLPGVSAKTQYSNVISREGENQ